MTGGSNKKVCFGQQIIIHEFPIILGDNPACSSGAPIQIDWEADNTVTRNLELYEYVRQEERKADRKQLVIPVQKRGQLLLKSGYSIEEIAQATMDADAIKDQRKETLRKQGWDRIAMMLETTGKIPRGIMKGVLGTTGDILSATGGLLVNTGMAAVGGLASTGRKMSKTFNVGGSAKPKTLQARSA